MRILIVGDIHWSAYSSIIRSRGNHFSTRLENLIKSLNWVEQISKEYKCEEEIFLGDTFDRPDLNAEEISALSEIDWNKTSRLKHFIVGNHESGISSLIYNSTQVLHKIGVIEDTPYIYPLDEHTEILFLPYIIEDNRKHLVDYLEHRNKKKKLIICSHNDLKGIRYGAIESKEGFTLPEIEENCDLFINGHLHNGGFVNESKTILNLGILTGQNFTENAFVHSHNICILDTETLKMEFIENPFAFNFYKIEIHKEEDLKLLNNLKPNSVISIKCIENYVDILKQELTKHTNIIESRTIIQRNETETTDGETVTLSSNDYLKQFYDFTVQKLGRTEIVLHELKEVCK